eukprot:CAMPEP_0171199322 /NCGR_PEP_ID=MMETSP0790-20130122/23405_1 /TAXON_ID=2925 /ORGANISM="Alexandrium catenella, Strain OF101" /LENGTH=60 /DNA_ID=CAMNT_0011664667 /DNA_START=358 /DNA_END=537 /DNA_ORIENTATION=+
MASRKSLTVAPTWPDPGAGRSPSGTSTCPASTASRAGPKSSTRRPPMALRACTQGRPRAA